MARKQDGSRDREKPRYGHDPAGPARAGGEAIGSAGGGGTKRGVSQFCRAWPLCRTTASSCPTILGHTHEAARFDRGKGSPYNRIQRKAPDGEARMPRDHLRLTADVLLDCLEGAGPSGRDRAPPRRPPHPPRPRRPGEPPQVPGRPPAPGGPPGAGGAGVPPGSPRAGPGPRSRLGEATPLP